MMNDEDRAFIAEHAPAIAMGGGVGAEQWRPAGFEDSVRSIQLLDKLGYPAWGFTEQTQSWYFRSGWTSDLVPTASLLPDYDAFYDTFALIAAVGPQTKQIRLFTTTDCYRRPPSLLAQTMLTLDHITRGRVGVRIGTGEDKQFVPHGLERKAPQHGRLEEFIRIVKALMRTTEPLTLDGRFWPQRDALIALPSYHPDAPPPVILVGGGPAAMKIAGRVADGLGTYLPGAYANRLEAFEEDLATFREEAARHDRDPDTLPVGPETCSVLCESDEQIAAALESSYIRASALNLTPTGKHWRQWGSKHPLGDDWALSRTHRSTLFSREELLEIVSRVTPEDLDQIFFIGTPEDVARRCSPWFRAAGIRDARACLAPSFGPVLFPELRELAEDGLPRWHHLQKRFQREMQRLLGID